MLYPIYVHRCANARPSPLAAMFMHWTQALHQPMPPALAGLCAEPGRMIYKMQFDFYKVPRREREAGGQAPRLGGMRA